MRSFPRNSAADISACFSSEAIIGPPTVKMGKMRRNNTNFQGNFVRRLGAALLASLCVAWIPNSFGSGKDGLTALRTGEYAKAKEYFQSALKGQPNDEESQAGLLKTLRQTGEYREASKRASTFLASNGNAPSVYLERARALTAVGDYKAAEEDFRQTIKLAESQKGSARPVQMDAKCELASLLNDLGRKTEARSLWESLLDVYRAGGAIESRELGDIAVAAWRRGYIEDAKDLFLDATEANESEGVPLEAFINFGHLFLEKYNATDAIGAFRDCLEINKNHPDALVGIALGKQYESNAEVEAYARKALETNPNLVPAINLLAGLRMDEEDYEGAIKEVRRALAVNPADLESLSLEAAYYLVCGNKEVFAASEKKVLNINPNYGRFYYILAENMISLRKYQEAVDFNRKAVALDPQLWEAWASLGMNLTRVGDLAGGRQAIQKAFDGDPYNVWAFNSLDLLDQIDKFKITSSEHFVYRTSKEDESALSPHAIKLAEEAYAKLTERYGFTPKGPIEIEAFPDHEGFAVRTLGLPGLGALGVCFGKVIAIDSPRARRTGTFNWGSTLWHEFAHVITVQMTNHNIPRWYSEGLSVYEEHRARPGWGDDLTAAFVKAYKEGKLLKVSELNAGMMRPKNPGQIALSYYQAALVCELIEEKFGFEKIKQTLLLFARNEQPEKVFKEALGWDSATFDSEYARFLDARLQTVASRLDFSLFTPAERAESEEKSAPAQSVETTNLNEKSFRTLLSKNPDNFFANLQLGLFLLEKKTNREAEIYLKKATQLFPEFTEEGNPYQALGEMYLKEGRDDDALIQWLGWSRYDENSSQSLVNAAEIYSKKKDMASAAKELELSLYINPYDTGALTSLGEAAMACNSWQSAIAAYQALIGLNTTDPAGAHYGLARALLGANKPKEARKEVIRALEIAPTFEKAQELLLKLSGEAR
jgi:cellulose synthase operon protein C